MQGLKIKTVTGKEFEIYGTVKYDSGIYYCAGASWPEGIVVEVIR